jgi:hypothetical protein
MDHCLAMGRAFVVEVVSILTAYFHTWKEETAVGVIAGTLMVAFSLWVWRQQILKYPHVKWKLVIKYIFPRRLDI